MEGFPASVLVPKLCMGHSWPVGHRNLLCWVLQPTSHQLGEHCGVFHGAKAYQKDRCNPPPPCTLSALHPFALLRAGADPKYAGPRCSAAFGSSAQVSPCLSVAHVCGKVSVISLQPHPGYAFLHVCIFTALQAKKKIRFFQAAIVSQESGRLGISTLLPESESQPGKPLISAGSSHSPLWSCQFQQRQGNLLGVNGQLRHFGVCRGYCPHLSAHTPKACSRMLACTSPAPRLQPPRAEKTIVQKGAGLWTAAADAGLSQCRCGATLSSRAGRQQPARPRTCVRAAFSVPASQPRARAGFEASFRQVWSKMV